MEILVHTKQHSYPILLEKGALKRAKEFLPSAGQVFLISDDGVPEKWRNLLQAQYPGSTMLVLPQGESSKSFPIYEKICLAMQQANLSRNDLVIALGGGVVGDVSGFAASTYMRGIRYANIPTTMLSQIDSSIGGKTAIDCGGMKNSVGTFWQPSAVLVDPEVLSTLDPRQLSNGFAEAIKMGLISDEKLWSIFENSSIEDHIEEIIERCLRAKQKIVEEDERENGKRKLLNFGHTFGHAYESCYGLDTYLHGECVGMGMVTILEDPDIKERLKKVLEKVNLPVSCTCDPEKVVECIQKDKKADHETITIVQVSKIGEGHLENWTMEDIKRRAKQ